METRTEPLFYPRDLRICIGYHFHHMGGLALEEYEMRRGVLPDPAARDTLARTPVVLQVEWTKPLTG